MKLGKLFDDLENLETAVANLCREFEREHGQDLLLKEMRLCRWNGSTACSGTITGADMVVDMKELRRKLFVEKKGKECVAHHCCNARAQASLNKQA